MTQREYDLVMFGATGFTGALTAGYLARHVPDGCRWALAGRSRDKLESVRTQLAAVDPDLAGLPLLIADVTDAGSLRTVAAMTRVLVTTVGPYLAHGEPLVAACADAGTDYLDLTGESEFVDLMYLRHHARAVETGARLIHCCGFDSIPHDLGVRYTVQQLPLGVPLSVTGVLRAGGTASGGTVHSAIGVLARLRAASSVARHRARAEPLPDGRVAVAPTGLPRRQDGLWLLPLPTVDAQVVARSARASERYGPDFSYRHYAGFRRLPTAAAALLGAAGVAGLAQLPPTRRLLLSRIAPGDGPSPERRSKAWFRVRFTGVGGGRRVVTEVAGGDPGYDETAKMLGESALCIAFDDLPVTSGQVTTATAMGEALTARLIAAGLTFRVVTTA